MEKKVKVRKVHNCELCGREIQIGEIALYYAFREPMFDDTDKQTGIQYINGYLCVEGKCLPFED